MGTKLKDISVGKDDSVWAVGKDDGRIYRLIGDAGFVGFVPDRLGRGESIAAVDWGSVYTVNKAGEIWSLTGGEMYLDGTWTKMETASGQNDAKVIAYGGTPWYIQTDGQIMRPRDNVGASFWMPAANGRGVSVAPSGLNATCVNEAGEIWGFNHSTDEWSVRDATANAKVIASASGGPSGGGGHFFYVSKDGELYQNITGEGWRKDSLPGSEQLRDITVVSVGTNSVWCLNEAGDAFHLFENKWEKFVERQGYTEWNYTVKVGDQLNKIVMDEFGLTNANEITARVNMIAVANGIQDANQINAGQVLHLVY